MLLRTADGNIVYNNLFSKVHKNRHRFCFVWKAKNIYYVLKKQMICYRKLESADPLFFENTSRARIIKSRHGSAQLWSLYCYDLIFSFWICKKGHLNLFQFRDHSSHALSRHSGSLNLIFVCVLAVHACASSISSICLFLVVGFVNDYHSGARTFIIAFLHRVYVCF